MPSETQKPASMQEVLAAIGKEFAAVDVDIEVLKKQAVGAMPVEAPKGYLDLAKKYGEEPALYFMEFLRTQLIDTSAQEAELKSKLPPEAANLMGSAAMLDPANMQASIKSALEQSIGHMRAELAKAGVAPADIDGVINDMMKEVRLSGDEPLADAAEEPAAKQAEASLKSEAEFKAAVEAEKAKAKKVMADELQKVDADPSEALQGVEHEKPPEPAEQKPMSQAEIQKEIDKLREQASQTAQQEMGKADLDFSEIKSLFE